MNKPFLVEFTGTPEAGKTSTIIALNEILKSEGLKIGIVQEAASRIYENLPRGTNNYSIWTFVTTVKEIVEQMNKNYDIVLVDRGVLDRTFWNLFSYNKKDLSLHEKQIRDEFMLSDFIPYKSDLLFAFKIPSDESIKRKGKEGSWVNKGNIDLYNYTLEQFISNFKKLNVKTKLSIIDTYNVPKEEITQKVKKIILDNIDKM